VVVLASLHFIFGLENLFLSYLSKRNSLLFYMLKGRVYQESLLDDLIDEKIQDNKIVKSRIVELYSDYY